ncbi:MAG: hypothetical protein ACJ8M4_01300 [Chthoniobacterales bacterium]
MRRILLLCFLGLSACVSIGSGTRSSLVGDWHYRDETQTCHYSFRSDGQFSGEVTMRKKLVSKFTGKWSVKGDRLLYAYTGDALGRIPVGATDSDRLLKIEKDSFLIEAADGSRRRYERGK